MQSRPIASPIFQRVILYALFLWMAFLFLIILITMSLSFGTKSSACTMSIDLMKHMINVKNSKTLSFFTIQTANSLNSSMTLLKRFMRSIKWWHTITSSLISRIINSIKLRKEWACSTKLTMKQKKFQLESKQN